MPWLSRLGDRPRTTDQADVHYAAAVESLLNELLNEDSLIAEPLKTVLLELDFNYNKARQLFSSMLAKRDQWLRHLLQNDLPSLRSTLEQAWTDVINEQINQLETALSDGTTAQLIKLAVKASQNIKLADGQESFLAPFAGLDVDGDQGLESDSINTLPVDKLSVQQWQALCQLVLLADGKGFRKTVTIKQGFVAKSAEKEAMLALLTEFADDHVLREIMLETTLLPQARFSDQDWQQLLSLEAVLKALAAFLQLRFRSVGECDHSEVTQRANLALQELDNPTDLGLRMDYHIHHILVDEFQDTSNGQIELLKRLTSGWTQQQTGAPKTLFLVGDPMQSIYRFREADVSLFLQVANNKQTRVFENVDIESLSLTENFRSSSDLVTWFNDTFEQSFPQKNNVLTGAINYAPASSNKTKMEGDVVYQLAHGKQQEAALLVAQVEQALKEQSEQQDDHGKVAILVRTRGQLKTILPALQEAGIHYSGVDIQPLQEQQAVIDVLSLCKAICRTDDRISWMALLRGPWCGLTLSELKLIASRNDITIWQQLNDEALIAQLNADTVARLSRFKKILEQTLAQRQQVELGNLTRWAWRSLGGEQTLFSASVDDIETVFDLIDGLQRGGDLPSINDLDKALQGLYAVPSANANGDSQPRVVVSTMHKSKGLQYDTVILPGLSNRPRVDEREIMMWAEHQNQQGLSNLLLAPLRLGSSTSAHFEYLRKLESKRAGNEAIRLMYVAATRAERKLVLLANADINEETGEVKAPASSSLLATLWDALSAKFDFPLEPIQEDESSQTLAQNLLRLNDDYRTEYEESVQWQVAQQLNAQQEAIEEVFDDEQEVDDESQRYDWATNAASGVGTVLHEWLQYNGANVLAAQIDQAQLNAWRTELIALRVPDTHIEYAVRNLKQAVENIKTDSQAHFIFNRYDIDDNEYVLSVFEDGVVKKSVIDRTFVDEDNVRWIIDYKSTPTKNKDLQAFAQEQVKTRHQAQLERYGTLMSEIDSRPIQLAVYFPLIKQLVSWPYKPDNLK